MAEGPYPIPSRTRKSSPPAPMVLQGPPCGRVGRHRIYAPDTKVSGASLLVVCDHRCARQRSRTGWNEALASSNTRDLRAAIRVAIIASADAAFGQGHCGRFRRGNASHGQRTRQPGPRSGPNVRASAESLSPPRVDASSGLKAIIRHGAACS
jgi:hypothetical protein